MDAEDDGSRKHNVEEASGSGNSAAIVTEEEENQQDADSTSLESRAKKSVRFKSPDQDRALRVEA